jgi:beta-galactosidase/beta-glucuronidase
VTFELAQAVKAWKGGERLAIGRPEPITLAPGESRAVRQTIEVPGAHLWSPEDPFLHVLDTTTGGDSLATRFGMREFRYDTATKRAYLNGRPYLVRGSNITLHRFFEDPDSGELWDEAWVRLLGEIEAHWNAFRFCIGPVPDN